MNTDEEINTNITFCKGLYNSILQRKKDFTDSLKEGKTIDPVSYDYVNELIDRAHEITHTHLSVIHNDNAILKKELDYFTKLANIQYDEPTEVMRNMNTRINNEIIKLKKSILLRVKYTAIVLQTNSLATSLKVLANKMRTTNLSALALNTVMQKIKSKKMTERDELILSDYEKRIQDSDTERSEIKVGSYVMCNYKGNPDTQYLCTVINISNKNKYDVKYADDEVERNVNKKNITPLPELINVLSEHVKNSAKAHDSHGGKTRRRKR